MSNQPERRDRIISEIWSRTMAPAIMSFGTKQCRWMAAQSQPRLLGVRVRPWQAAARGLQKITAGIADPFESAGFCRETALTPR
jgi:hypothetical protein